MLINNNSSFKNFIMCIVFMQFTLIPIFSQNNTIYISNEITCSIPQGWSVADQEVVDALNKMKLEKGFKESSLKYFLYSNVLTNESGYPNISIGYQHLGFNSLDHTSFNQIVSDFYKSFNSEVKPSLEKMVGEYFDEIKVNSIVTNEGKRSIIYKTEMGIPNVGQIINYMCLIYCKLGVVRISLAVQKIDEEKALPAFKIILKTLKN
ncbi:MAG: hypothetical protein IPN10_13705 [Saprospiraceae bacterium]|nr:hypothetical protein [Saprospiraceae bacterium]